MCNKAIVSQLDDIEALHGEIDRLAAQLAAHHADRLRCERGCSGCCVDDITVFEVEAELIRARHPEVLKSAPHAPGACAFLDDEGSCRVYASRPYVCRTQGLPLRWVEQAQDESGAWVEHRDICELNEPGPLITDLRPGECWTIGPAETKLYALQKQRGEVKRVALRALFDDRE